MLPRHASVAIVAQRPASVAASLSLHTFVSKMAAPCARWLIHFAMNPLVSSWKNTLRETVNVGQDKVTFRDVSQFVVELVWRNPVTCESPSKLVLLAAQQNASMAILGEPIGIAADVYLTADEVAAVAPTGIADDSRGAPDEAAPVALAEAAATHTKRKRIPGERDSPASHVVPRPDVTEIHAIAYHAEIWHVPADDAQPATQKRRKSTPTLAEAASAPEMLPSENNRFEDTTGKYELAWECPGTFGTLYAGIQCGVVDHAVAIKLIACRGEDGEDSKDAAAESRRYLAIGHHPHIVKLLDVVFFGRRACHLRLAWSSSASTQTSGSS
jgi:hypothetical protein